MREFDRRQKRQTVGPVPGPLHERVLVSQVAALIAARQREGQSVRSLAAEIDISRGAVDKLLQAFKKQGPMPEPRKNWPKLKKWYIEQKYANEGDLQEPVDMQILSLEFIYAIPEANRHAALRRMVRAFREMHDESGVPYPAWLDRMIAAIAQRDAAFGPPPPPG